MAQNLSMLSIARRGMLVHSTFEPHSREAGLTETKLMQIVTQRGIALLNG
jgi:hypothetical protein